MIQLNHRVDHSSNFNIENKTSANNILNESSLIHNNETLVESSLIDENIVIKPYDTEKQINKTLPYNYKEDPDNPKNWPKMKKRICIALILINSFLPYFSSVIYIPATQDIMSTFKIDLTAITSTFSLYMIICGFMVSSLRSITIRHHMFITKIYFSPLSPLRL